MTEKRTILLVDDVQMFRDLGSLFLARVGHVITAESGEQALDLARRESPHLMLVDLLMPHMDGDEVCRFVKNDPELHSIPVVMLVGDDDPIQWGRAVRSGADDVLAKPISRVTLNETVNRFLREGTTPGLQRVEMNVPVELTVGSRSREGKMRNLSRGGLFIETDCRVSQDCEIGLRFRLPETDKEIRPTARVIWRHRDPLAPDRSGIGVRFVDISGGAIRTLEDYVFDRAIEPRLPQPPSVARP